MSGRRDYSKQVAVPDEARASEYVRIDKDPGKPGHFVLRWVPSAPETRHEVIVDAFRGQLEERVTLRVGCPHCHEDIEFRYDHGAGGEWLMPRLMAVLAEVGGIAFGIAFLHLGKPALLQRLVDVAEELNKKLRR